MLANVTIACASMSMNASSAEDHTQVVIASGKSPSGGGGTELVGNAPQGCDSRGVVQSEQQYSLNSCIRDHDIISLILEHILAKKLQFSYTQCMKGGGVVAVC